MTVPLWAWAAFVAFVVAMLALDLFVLHRRAHEVSLTEAGAWSAVWVALGLGFGGLLWAWDGGDTAQAYLAGYLIEKSLSLDNVFVFTVIFAMFAIPLRYQHRVLMAGIIGALGLRAAFIAGGAALLHSFHAVVYVFGALLLWTAIRMLRSDGHLQPGRGLPRVIQRILPTTSQLHGQRFLVREGGRWLATPLLAALIVVEAADVIFAVDSIPAIFAVTTDTFVVFTSNVFALLGLRALYFLLAGAVGRLRYLRPALSIILAAAAAKLLLSDVYTIPVWVSPAFIVSVLAVAAGLSLWEARVRPAAGPRTGPAAAPSTAPTAAPSTPQAKAPSTPRVPAPSTPRPATPRTRPAPALNGESPVRGGSGPGRERDEAATDVNTVYSKQ
jgi:tellurite resistance protein TerC